MKKTIGFIAAIIAGYTLAALAASTDNTSSTYSTTSGQPPFAPAMVVLQSTQPGSPAVPVNTQHPLPITCTSGCSGGGGGGDVNITEVGGNAVTTTLPVSGTVSITANSAVNTAQVAGTTTAVNNGTASAGAQRVVIASDNSPVAGLAVGATGSAVPANAVYNGTSQSGVLKGLISCDSHAKYDASDNGSITLVAGVSAKKIYICGFTLATGGTATNLKLREGSDANCATNAADLTPAYQLTANNSFGVLAPFWTGLAVSTNAYYVCVNASAGNAHQAELFYTIQ